MNIKNNVPLFSAALANAGLNFITPLTKTLDSHWYVLGQEVAHFEREFADYVGVSHCISVANGSDALEIALKGLNVGIGDRVIAVANAGFYGSTAIHAVGAQPVYIDVDPKTLTLCTDSLKSLVDSKPSAIIVTHLYGQLANIEAIVAIASAADIPVIEDCAQSHGARRNGKQAGSFGTIGCFSFYPTKNLGALGDGGAIVTQSDALASRVRQLRQYGWSQKYEVAIPGGRNSRLDEIQAAILRVKLPHLDSWNEQRRSIAARYNAAFAKFDVQLPCSTGEDFVAHLYVIRVEDRAALSAALKEKSISTDIHYPIADHHQPAYNVAGKFSLAETEQACNTVISLPCFPGLSDDEVDRVIAAVTAHFSKEI
ncbi:DegT/DnrJ/EryC1/StrS family aminotransferase [Pseudomonas savastanoi]|uniref:Erythromycin biosynthesis sensory transduction protein eryC1 n=1 Tax=Pseudomonas savastanoi TaxID=29438 RepID=A0AAW3M3N2_PSESS|nr:DegT/DnrJ/EryC1/StrS family aminotransferase [Pseudomonas savastanoi]KTC60989.1 erythromycin biosynthesis sensory transduction protein eryC1 [Pseudomonas savastanoi]